MKQMPPINIPKIQNDIRVRHKEFIKGLGPQIQKAVADNRLLTDLISTRVYHILLCFREEGIIDEIITSNNYPKKHTLMKSGFDNYVYILTNGHMIRIEGYNMSGDDFRSDVQLPGKDHYGVDHQNYDWEKFAMELLDYIHVSIYDREDALEAKISGLIS